MSAAISGFLLGGGLIIAIGAQNAFVLRQGLARQFVFSICLFCALADSILIALGVAGVGTIIATSPSLLAVATIGGAIFLVIYGLLAFRRAWAPQALDPTAADGGKSAAGGAITSRRAALAVCLAFTILNPHVYLDTVVLIGSVSGTYAGWQRIAFATGAVTASFVWFFALGYGARLLAPIFARPLSWRVLDAGIGIVMFALAIGLIQSAAG